MAVVVNITSINPFTFELQEYSASDNSLITSFNIDTIFDPSTDYLEYFIYDLNGNILVQNVSGYPGYKLINNNIVLNPEADLKAYGFEEGQYNTVYNFLSPKLASNSFNTYFISEISSDRTELRLDTPLVPDPPVILVIKRKAVRLYPDGTRIALYWSDKLKRVFSVPYGTSLEAPVQAEEYIRELFDVK